MRNFTTAVTIVGLLAALSGKAQKPTPNELVKIGGISAENGEFSIIDNLITAYSDRDISVENGSAGKRDFITTEGGAVSFRVQDEGMQKVAANPPIGASNSFAFCDWLDQVAVPVEGSIRAILPKDAKVKETEHLIDGRILVAYSLPGGEFYKLFLSLLASKPGGRFAVVGNGLVSEDGVYCGQQAIAKYIRAALVNEPSGSSDFSVVYLFAIKEEKPPEKH